MFGTHPPNKEDRPPGHGDTEMGWCRPRIALVYPTIGVLVPKKANLKAI